MQRDRDIEIQQIRLFDVFTLEAVPVLDLEAIEDLLAMGLQIIHHLLQHRVAPGCAKFVCDFLRYGV